MLDYTLEVNKFKLESFFYVHFWTNTLVEKYEAIRNVLILAEWSKMI